MRILPTKIYKDALSRIILDKHKTKHTIHVYYTCIYYKNNTYKKTKLIH